MSNIYSPGPTWYPIVTQLLAETLATVVLIFYGDGAGAQNFFFESNFLEVSLGWGAAATIGIIIGGGKASPALMNPGITIATTIAGRLRWSLLPLYIVSEVFGGFIGAALILAVYNEPLTHYANTVDGGHFYVNSTGNIFVAGKNSSIATAVTDQIITTALMVIAILAMGDKHNTKIPGKLVPIFVGMAVYIAVATYSANASSALNPARDLGPRFLLFVTYWGSDAFTIDSYYFWVPALMPIVGAVLGTIVYEVLIGIHAKGAEMRPTDIPPQDDNCEQSLTAL